MIHTFLEMISFKVIVFFVCMLLIQACTGKGKGDRKTDILWATDLQSISDYSSDFDIREATIVDIDNNGLNEIMIALQNPPRIYILNGTNGEIVKVLNYSTQDYLVAGDLNNDAEKEIVLSPLRVVNKDGILLWSIEKIKWDETIIIDGNPYYFPVEIFPQRPFLFDINQNGLPDVITTNIYVCAINGIDGKVLWCTSPGFDFTNENQSQFLGRSLGVAHNNSNMIISNGCKSFVGRIDCPYESFECSIYAINGMDGKIVWSKPTGGCDANIYGIVDVDKDGVPDIVASHDEYKNVECTREGSPSIENVAYTVIDVYNLGGSLLYSYNLQGKIKTTTGTLIGGFNDNFKDGLMAFGEIEGEMHGIVVVTHPIDSDKNGTLDCGVFGESLDTFRLRDGIIISSFYPAGGGNEPSDFTPIAGDIDGDGKIEIAYLSYPYIQTYNPEDGSALWWYDVGRLDTNVIFSTGGHGARIKSKPVIGDVNGDGLLEIVVIGDKDVNPDDDVAEYKQFVFALKTGARVPSSSDLLPWPMSYHDPYRTGNYNFVE